MEPCSHCAYAGGDDGAKRENMSQKEGSPDSNKVKYGGDDAAKREENKLQKEGSPDSNKVKYTTIRVKAPIF